MQDALLGKSKDLRSTRRFLLIVTIATIGNTVYGSS